MAVQGKRATIRREGVTPTERELGKLADRTFLSLWSYPGVYREQHTSSTGDGKELCDLLVVFEDNIIIFSDKAIEYRETIQPEVAWQRWFRKAVVESANQSFGAERWLKQFPDRIYMDSSCTQKFPIPLPPPEEMKVHRIVVARGSGAAAKNYFGENKKTSLMLNSNLKTKEDHLSGSAPPFTIGQVNPKRGFIHVLDDATLDIVLGTLDTIRDFLYYLERKENLFTSGPGVSAAGEEDLLAYYLRQIGSDNKNDFVFPEKHSFVVIGQGYWDDFKSHPQRLAQIQADKDSYLWDDLIDRYSKHAFSDTQYSARNLEHPMEAESILRFLAREDRTSRRILVQGFIEIFSRMRPRQGWDVKVVGRSAPGDPTYVLMVTQMPNNINYQQFRENRGAVLSDYLQCAKLTIPDSEHIVGIAIGHPNGADKSEDAMHLDCTYWTVERRAVAERIQSETGYLKSVNRYDRIETTYPDLNPRVLPSHRKRSRADFVINLARARVVKSIRNAVDSQSNRE